MVLENRQATGREGYFFQEYVEIRKAGRKKLERDGKNDFINHFLFMMPPSILGRW